MGKIKVGDLYKIIEIDHVKFYIKYGYYDDNDKYSKYSEPIPIFPDFINSPQYNHEGYSFVTHLQDKCKHYIGNNNDDCCYHCSYFEKKEDLIGLCKCQERKIL